MRPAQSCHGPTGRALVDSRMRGHAGTVEVRCSRICPWVQPTVGMHFFLPIPEHLGRCKVSRWISLALRSPINPTGYLETRCAPRRNTKHLHRPWRYYPQKNRIQLAAGSLVPAVVLRRHSAVQLAVQLDRKQPPIPLFVNANDDKSPCSSSL